jgi:uncharacterized membrane protein YeaQ/YmgE (transglycosylase-associated protein family)
MGVLSWIVLGLIAGVLAKMLMPGKDPGGLIVTILIGITGAFLGGWIGTQMGMASFDGFSLKGIVVATAGALVLLVIYRLIAGRRRLHA